ncbi:MAG: hypothetical protein A3H99_07450 [Gallionellales bacterium RIFCSPLOWO2_02_FULL_59_110]|nr:MAG: hypothetical protein A3H99_07450 [Gallionellales bacterium RIFCSPLOWO2_02_FULL_59_110]
MPVDLTKLRSLIVPRVKLADLTAALESMCQRRELQTCNGIKGGKAYVCYWISGNLPPAWGKPSKVAADVKKPATVPARKKKQE